GRGPGRGQAGRRAGGARQAAGFRPASPPRCHRAPGRFADGCNARGGEPGRGRVQSHALAAFVRVAGVPSAHRSGCGATAGVSRAGTAVAPWERPGRRGWWALAAAVASCVVGAGLAVKAVQEWRRGVAVAPALDAVGAPFAAAPGASDDWTREERARIASV